MKSDPSLKDFDVPDEKALATVRLFDVTNVQSERDLDYLWRHTKHIWQLKGNWFDYLGPNVYKNKILVEGFMLRWGEQRNNFILRFSYLEVTPKKIQYLWDCSSVDYKVSV